MRLDGIIVFVFLVCVFIVSYNRRDGGDVRSLAEDLVACSRDDNAACLHACQQGAGDACYLAGLKEHQARDGDAAHARFLFRRACKLKDWMSCLLVSQMMEAGIGGPTSRSPKTIARGRVGAARCAFACSEEGKINAVILVILQVAVSSAEHGEGKFLGVNFQSLSAR